MPRGHVGGGHSRPMERQEQRLGRMPRPPSVRAQRRSRGREVQGRAGGKEVGEAGGPDASGPEGCSDGLAFSELGS